MEVRHLKYFLAVADGRSFLQASETLYVSRQAVSKAIRQLEDELGVSLFVRTQNGAMMTPAGINFYPKAAALTAEFERLSDEMKNVDGNYRPRINIYMAFGAYDIFARRLHDYSVSHWSEMDIEVGACLDVDCELLLSDRRADAVLSFTPINNKMLETSQIMETPLCILVSRDSPLAAQSVLDRRILREYPALLYTGGHKGCPWWPQKLSPDDICCADLSSLFSRLRAGEGYMPFPRAMVPDYADFAEIRPCGVTMPSVSLFYATLTPAYYDALTYNLMGAVEKDVFLKGL